LLPAAGAKATDGQPEVASEPPDAGPPAPNRTLQATLCSSELVTKEGDRCFTSRVPHQVFDIPLWRRLVGPADAGKVPVMGDRERLAANLPAAQSERDRDERIVKAVVDRIDVTLKRMLAPLLAKIEKKLGMPVQEWFSIEQTAVLTGLSNDHVRRHVTSGLLPVSNQGTFEKPYYRIHRKDIDEWMAKRRETPLPARRKQKAAVPGSYVSRHHDNT